MESLPLKDIHLPEPLSWWPPAPGWIILAILIPLLVVGSYFIYKRIKQKTALKTARYLLDAIKKEKHQHPLSTLTALSALLRRVAISVSPRSDVASLRGEAWLNFLDGSCKDKPFTTGVGRCLADAQYRPNLPADTDMEALFKLCECWLKQQKSPGFSFLQFDRLKMQRKK